MFKGFKPLISTGNSTCVIIVSQDLTAAKERAHCPGVTGTLKQPRVPTGSRKRLMPPKRKQKIL